MWTFQTDGDYINFNGGGNLWRLHKNSNCVSWHWDETGDLFFDVYDQEYTVKAENISSVVIDGTPLTEAADFETQIKRIFPGGGGTESVVSSATPAINTDSVDIFKLTAQAVDITSFTTNLTGTPTDGQVLEIQITGTAQRNITWGDSFVSTTVALPAATDGVVTLTVILQYYTTSSYGNNKWHCVNYY